MLDQESKTGELKPDRREQVRVLESHEGSKGTFAMNGEDYNAAEKLDTLLSLLGAASELDHPLVA